MAARVSRASDRSLVIQWLNMARRDAIIVDFHALNIQFAYSFFFLWVFVIGMFAVRNIISLLSHDFTRSVIYRTRKRANQWESKQIRRNIETNRVVVSALDSVVFFLILFFLGYSCFLFFIAFLSAWTENGVTPKSINTNTKLTHRQFQRQIRMLIAIINKKNKWKRGEEKI